MNFKCNLPSGGNVTALVITVLKFVKVVGEWFTPQDAKQRIHVI